MTPDRHDLPSFYKIMEPVLRYNYRVAGSFSLRYSLQLFYDVDITAESFITLLKQPIYSYSHSFSGLPY